MLDETPDQSPESTESSAADTPTAPVAKKAAPRKRAAKKAAAPTVDEAAGDAGGSSASESSGPRTVVTTRTRETTTVTPRKSTPKKAAAKKTTAKKTVAAKEAGTATPAGDEGEAAAAAAAVPLFQAPRITVTRRSRSTAKAVAAPEAAADTGAEAPAEEKPAPRKRSTRRKPADAQESQGAEPDAHETGEEAATTHSTGAADAGETTESSGETTTDASGDDEHQEGSGGGRRRRRRGGRRRRRGSGSNGSDGHDDQSGEQDETTEESSEATQEPGEDKSGEGDKHGDAEKSEGSSSSRRRRRRRRAGDSGGESADDPEKTTTRVRKKRNPEDEITAVSGSTRLQAKKQRRREGREAGRRRAPIVSEAEFLARREAVDRTMVVRERDDLTQIAVLEDKVLVEHYVARESQTSLIGNVYLGRVQNVLPSMEAAFIDIGKGRNAVLYAGEVNWKALGHKEGTARTIESVLSSGQLVLVQVTKDPIGHKGARLTSQVSLPGRFLVYVPDGTNSGISRKLPDTERSRLKALLKQIVPDHAGVIVRTAAEGASEEELTRDVERLTSKWDTIEKKAKKANSPTLLYGEPDLTLKVVRDLFTEDFGRLVIEGDKVWETIHGYVEEMAPDLEDRLEKFTPQDGLSAFSTYRIDEQIAKGLDRKVWLPSGGSLIIDRTEAMTVVDVNTGKFTGSGGNLEETVTKNNLEAAEEIVRQLRLRDIGGIIVIDFIDMVLESNRDLVLRRLVECLGRDRTRHQVAEVTSLGLVQMTRKRIGVGLVEAFSETCSHCAGRGLVVHDSPIDHKHGSDNDGGGSRRGRRGRGGRGRGGSSDGSNGGNGDGDQQHENKPTPQEFAAMARSEKAETESGKTESGKTEDASTIQPEAEHPTDPAAPAEASAEDAAQAEGAAEEPTPIEEPTPAEGTVEEKPTTRTRRTTRKRSTPKKAAGPESVDGETTDDAPAEGGSTGTAQAPAPERPSDEVEAVVNATEDAPGTGEDATTAESEAAVSHVPVKTRSPRKR